MSRSTHRLSLTRKAPPVEPDVYDLQPLIDRYFDEHRARNHSPRTIHRYGETFADLSKYLDLIHQPLDTSALSSASLAGFTTWLRDTTTKVWRGSTKRSIYTTHGRLKDLKAFCKWLVDEDVLVRLPKIPMPKLPDTMFRILTDDQLKVLFSCTHLTSSGDQATRNRALISLLLDTGIRLAELVSMDMAAVDLDNRIIKVKGKGNKERYVFFSSGVAANLSAWLAIRGNEEGQVFWLSARGVQQLFKRIQEETGLPVHCHLLRHQSATFLVRNNTDVDSVRRILGHSDISTTLRYLSQSTEDLQAKHAAASPFETLRGMMPEPDKKVRRKRLSL